MMSEYNFDRTSKSGTETMEGFIPHLFHNGLKMPVMLDFSKKSKEGIPPLRDNGYLIFALPGQQKFVSDRIN